MFGDLSTLVQQYHGLTAVPPAGLPFLTTTTTTTSPSNVLFNLRGGSEKKKELPFEDIFESHPSVDYSDNNAQVRVIKHHYMNEFGKHISLKEVMKDYSDDIVIHEVVDNVPRTYRGREGVRRAFRDMYRKIPHDTSHFEFEHIAIDHDHAQVVWRAVIPDKDVIIRGMDSFAFDKENRIKNQSIMAISNEISSAAAKTTNEKKGQQ